MRRMVGWIIYSRNDIEKNRAFISMIKKSFNAYDIDVRLMILDEISDIEKHQTPDFVINRSRDYRIAYILENRGVKVFNSSTVTKIANDKAVTYEYLREIVKFMPVQCSGKNIISSRYKDDGIFEYPYIIKTVAGHGGSQVYMVEDDCQKKEVLEEIGNEKYLIQKVCSELGKDVRVYVIGNKIVEAVLRTSQDSFKSNYSLGGKVEKYNLSVEEKENIYRIINKLPIDYGGIDFVFHNGEVFFNEIEDAVGARMLYQVSDIDIVELFTKHIMENLFSRL